MQAKTAAPVPVVVPAVPPTRLLGRSVEGWENEGEFGPLMEIGSDGTEIVEGRTPRTISRERMRQFYDGTLLYRLVGEY